jgi:hypothetical protein
MMPVYTNILSIPFKQVEVYFVVHLQITVSRCQSHVQGVSEISVLCVLTSSGYGLDDRAIEVRSPAEAKGIFF